MNAKQLAGAFAKISEAMNENREYLVHLDQQNGDGDLGISMSNGFNAIVSSLSASEEKDLGKVLMASSKALNENSPSTLGTVLSIILMGMAKALRGKDEATAAELVAAMNRGVSLVSERAGSKEGEKTILDAICPALRAMDGKAADGWKAATAAGAAAAVAGAENTRSMIATHGRAAYYGEKNLGIIDGGAVVGGLIFTAISKYCE